MSAAGRNGFTEQDAARAIGELERRLAVTWEVCEVADGAAMSHARESALKVIENAIHLLARTEPISIPWETLRSGVTRYKADRILTPQFRQLMRFLLGLTAAQGGFDRVDYGLLFADVGRPLPPKRRLGVTRGQSPALLGLALASRRLRLTPIVTLHELLEGSQDSPEHPLHDSERSRRMAGELGEADSLPSDLYEEVVSLLATERALRDVRERLLEQPAAVDHLGGRRGALRLEDGFPRWLVSTELRIPRPDAGIESRYLGADDALVARLLADGFEVVLQAGEFTGTDTGRPPEALFARCSPMRDPEVVRVSDDDLRAINRHDEVLDATGHRLLLENTTYWTAREQVDGREVCALGRFHPATNRLQVFRVGSAGVDPGDARERALALAEVAVGREPIPAPIREQLRLTMPYQHGGSRASVPRTTMAVVNAAYGLLIEARARRA